jgi:hypothetical protein
MKILGRVFTNADWYFLGGVTAFLAAMTYLIVPWLSGINPTVAFIVLALLSSAMTIYVLGWRWSFMALMGLTLIYMVHDVAWPPLLVDAAGPVPGLPPSGSLSSDIFIWGFLPVAWAGYIKVFLTFVLIPSIILFVARLFFSRKTFREQVL